jgi:hypothetical protein
LCLLIVQKRRQTSQVWVMLSPVGQYRIEVEVRVMLGSTAGREE